MLAFFNNLKIKKKFILIYVFCVLFPIIITNGMMFTNVTSRLKENQETEMNQTAERIQTQIDGILQEIVKVSDYIYTDRQLEDFTQQDYESSADYYTSYFNFKKNHNFRSYFSSQSIEAIEIYTNNPSVINGDFYWELEEVKSELWYQIYTDKGDMSLIEYYDTQLQAPPTLKSYRKICFVKKLNYFTNDGYEVILKIDLNYNKMLASINSQNARNDIFVATEGKIIMENKGSGQIYQEMPVLSSVELVEPLVKNSFQAIDNEWDVYVLGSNPTLVSVLTENKLMLYLLITINFLVPTVCIVILNKSFRDRLSIAEKHLIKMEKGDFRKIDINEGQDEIGDLIRTYNYMVVQLTELINETYQKSIDQQALELSKKQIELNALQSQINPHFLYNVLDSIRMNSLSKGEDETGKVIEDLALLFRRMQKWEDNHFITVKEELFYVEKYLEIQKYRFSDRLDYAIYLEKDCELAKIPKLSITTFVENACIHGIERKIAGGNINITVVQVNGRLIIEVLDSGIGISKKRLIEIEEKIKRADIKQLNADDSTGILNAYLRVKGYYNAPVKLTINSEINEGTEIELELPFL